MKYKHDLKCGIFNTPSYGGCDCGAWHLNEMYEEVKRWEFIISHFRLPIFDSKTNSA